MRGAAGEVGAVVGYFGNVKHPADLPIDCPTGLVPAHWDGTDRPAVAIQLELGMFLMYQPAVGGPGDPDAWGDLWGYFAYFNAWNNFGQVAGPTGPAGPPGTDGIIGMDGATGAAGPPGPVAVSTEADNIARLGAPDGLLFVPHEVSIGPAAVAASELWVDTSVVGLSVWHSASKDYVNELITISTITPPEPPARDGLMWVVPRRLSGFPVTRTFVGHSGDWVEL